MEKKKSDLTNLSHDKKAQAGSSPELSSVFEEMKNGIDIQPLEDIMPEKFIEFEDHCGNDDNEGLTQREAKSASKKSSCCELPLWLSWFARWHSAHIWRCFALTSSRTPPKQFIKKILP